MDAGRAVMLLAGQMHPRFPFGKTKEKRGLYPCWTSPCGSRHPEAAIRRPLRIRPAVMAEFSRWKLTPTVS